MIYNQVTYVLSQDLGFDKENVITIEAPIFKTTNMNRRWKFLRTGYVWLTGIESVGI